MTSNLVCLFLTSIALFLDLTCEKNGKGKSIVDVKLILTLFARLPFTLLPKTMISGFSSDDCRHHYV